MLIDVKVKIAQTVDNRPVKKTRTYVLNGEFFTNAEYKVTELLNSEQSSHLVDSFQILSLRQSALKEIASQFQGDHSYIATLKDIFHDDEGNEKKLRYKVLLWADDLTAATNNARTLQREGYDMTIESLKEVDYIYIAEE